MKWPNTLNLGELRKWQHSLNHARQMNWRISIGLLMLLVWSAVAKVPQAAQGEARVVPSQRLQVIQAVDGGVITDVLVREGDEVKAGQTLPPLEYISGCCPTSV